MPSARARLLAFRRSQPPQPRLEEAQVERTTARAGVDHDVDADAEAARTGLMERFGLSEEQAQAILDLRLQRLTSLGQDEIRTEHAGLVARIA